MTTSPSILAPSIQDLEDTISDFELAPFQSAESVLARFIHQLDEEPMAGFLAAVLPKSEFSVWWPNTQSSIGSMAGSGILEWPAERNSRVAIQIALCRAISEKSVPFLDFVINYYYIGNNLSDYVEVFASRFLIPLLRDISRLTESRPVPPVLFEAMSNLPTSGDATLDSLLRDACLKFKDPAPRARAEATEKLWDAWERLKSLEVQGNK